MKTLLGKLLQIQRSIRGFKKDSQGDRYQFVSGTKVLNTVREKMDELGVLLVPAVDSITNVRQDYSTKYGEKSEALTTIMGSFTWICCDTGEELRVPFGGNGMNNWDKGFGSALTYAERYFILKFFHIPTDEDDVDGITRPDASPSKPAPAAKPELTPASKQWAAVVKKYASGTPITTIEQAFTISDANKAELLNQAKTLPAQ